MAKKTAMPSKYEGYIIIVKDHHYSPDEDDLVFEFTERQYITVPCVHCGEAVERVFAGVKKLIRKPSCYKCKYAVQVAKKRSQQGILEESNII